MAVSGNKPIEPAERMGFRWLFDRSQSLGEYFGEKPVKTNGILVWLALLPYAAMFVLEFILLFGSGIQPWMHILRLALFLLICVICVRGYIYAGRQHKLFRRYEKLCGERPPGGAGGYFKLYAILGAVSALCGLLIILSGIYRPREDINAMAATLLYPMTMGITFGLLTRQSAVGFAAADFITRLRIVRYAAIDSLQILDITPANEKKRREAQVEFYAYKDGVIVGHDRMTQSDYDFLLGKIRNNSEPEQTPESV
ncbi:MAG: hypothetical protein LBS90_05120 [Oscillospiraceae bacterium]|jgi:hypothetical protein|nr:hypothetical protein [Oscillospiraceae bacterium]